MDNEESGTAPPPSYSGLASGQDEGGPVSPRRKSRRSTRAWLSVAAVVLLVSVAGVFVLKVRAAQPVPLGTVFDGVTAEPWDLPCLSGGVVRGHIVIIDGIGWRALPASGQRGEGQGTGLQVGQAYTGRLVITKAANSRSTKIYDGSEAEFTTGSTVVRMDSYGSGCS